MRLRGKWKWWRGKKVKHNRKPMRHTNWRLDLAIHIKQNIWVYIRWLFCPLQHKVIASPAHLTDTAVILGQQKQISNWQKDYISLLLVLSECDCYRMLSGIFMSFDTSPPNTLINTITYRHCTHCTHNTLDGEHCKGTLVLHNLQGVVYIYYLHIHSVLDKLKYCTVQNIITKISLVLLNDKCYKIIPKNMEKIKIMVAANYCSTILNFH